MSIGPIEENLLLVPIDENLFAWAIFFLMICYMVYILRYEAWITKTHEQEYSSKLREEEEEAARQKLKENIASPGRVFRDAPFAPEMVEIPAGDFLMGSPEGEKKRYLEEGPQHRVVFPAPFALGKYEVTFDEFDHFVRESGHGHSPGDVNWGRGGRPVIDVSWDDAVTYCGWLSEATGHNYRLPTEAEWEYACRAGTKTPFHCGRTITDQEGNYAGDFVYDIGRVGKFRGKTKNVGRFPANPLGLHDMHGNVWEWCADLHEKGAYGEHTDVYPDMIGDLESFGERVVRGGSWINKPWNARSASRNWIDAGERHNIVGFRIARTL